MTEPTVEEIAPAPIAGDSRPSRRPRSPGRRRRIGLPRLSLRRTSGGIAAVGVKELRGRMRGRRAFVILTIYLLLLGGFAWMVELLMERSYTSGFGNSAAYASASIGQGSSPSLLMLETLQVVFLAPAATAGAISLEREKQTLDMLIATPITSVAIVLGKLLSALTYVFLLIVASVPLTAVVFVYGGVGPDDVLQGLRGPARDGVRARLLRPLLLEPRQADAGGHGDLDLRRPRGLDRVAVRADLLDRDGQHGPGPRLRPDQGPRARDRRLREPVHRPGGRAVRHGAVVRDLVQPDPVARPEPERHRQRRQGVLGRRCPSSGSRTAASSWTAA